MEFTLLDTSGNFTPPSIHGAECEYGSSSSLHIGDRFNVSSTENATADIDPSPMSGDAQIRCQMALNPQDCHASFMFSLDGGSNVSGLLTSDRGTTFERLTDACLAVSSTVVLHAPAGITEASIDTLLALHHRVASMTGADPAEDPEAHRMLDQSLVIRIPMAADASFSSRSGEKLLREAVWESKDDQTASSAFSAIMALFPHIEVATSLPTVADIIHDRARTVTPRVAPSWPIEGCSAGMVVDLASTMISLKARRSMPRLGEAMVLLGLSTAAEKSFEIYKMTFAELSLPVDQKIITDTHIIALDRAVDPIRDIFQLTGPQYKSVYMSVLSQTQTRLVPTRDGVTFDAAGIPHVTPVASPDSYLTYICKQNADASEATCRGALTKAIEALKAGPISEGVAAAVTMYNSIARGPSRETILSDLMSEIVVHMAGGVTPGGPVDQPTQPAPVTRPIPAQPPTDATAEDWASLDDIRQAVITIAENVRETADGTAMDLQETLDTVSNLQQVVDGLDQALHTVEADVSELVDASKDSGSQLGGVVTQLDEAYGAMMALQERQSVLETRMMANEGEVGRVRTGLMQVTSAGNGQTTRGTPKGPASPTRGEGVVRHGTFQAGLENVLERVRAGYAPLTAIDDVRLRLDRLEQMVSNMGKTIEAMQPHRNR